LGKPPPYDNDQMVTTLQETTGLAGSEASTKGNRYKQGVPAKVRNTASSSEFEKAKKLVAMYGDTEHKKQLLLDREITVKEIEIEERRHRKVADDATTQLNRENETAKSQAAAYMRDSSKFEMLQKYEMMVAQGKSRTFIIKLFPSCVDFIDDELDGTVDVKQVATNTNKLPPRPPARGASIPPIKRRHSKHHGSDSFPDAIATSDTDFDVDNLDDDDDYIFVADDASTNTSWTTLDLHQQQTTTKPNLQKIPEKTPRISAEQKQMALAAQEPTPERKQMVPVVQQQQEPTPKRQYKKRIIAVDDSPAAGTRSRNKSMGKKE
jgi:hypothetical protein